MELIGTLAVVTVVVVVAPVVVVPVVVVPVVVVPVVVIVTIIAADCRGRLRVHIIVMCAEMPAQRFGV